MIHVTPPEHSASAGEEYVIGRRHRPTYLLQSGKPSCPTEVGARGCLAIRCMMPICYSTKTYSCFSYAGSVGTSLASQGVS